MTQMPRGYDAWKTRSPDDDYPDTEIPEQTHCYQCGHMLGDVRYRCETCDEYFCSSECRDKHDKQMEDI